VQVTSTVEQPETADPGPPSRRRRASPLTIVGVILIVAGLSCLGWVAYQYFGTNVVSHRAFTQEKTELRVKWSSQQPARPGATPGAKPGQLQPAPLPGDAIALLRIPRFGADYEVPILEGTDLGVLSHGVGHYPNTADPGQVGNFAVAGHRVTHGQPFARLLELDKGDQVVVETRDAVYSYVLDTAPRDLTVEENASWVLDPVPGQPDSTPSRPLITLTTCQDLFHSPDRSIAFGHLASSQNKT
jgi:sortase A